MADRTSARLLGRVFLRLSGEPSNIYKNAAKDIFMVEVPNGDFSAYQMEADDALIRLGLAREMTPEECEREGVSEGIIYIHEQNF